nr:right-handed parallel beta-helix repeat-containing protein [uncultured Treponema sp.]
MRKKLNVFNTVLFTLIFCFMLGNCEDISFDKSLVKQIEDDTTCTVRFYVGNPIDVPVGTENPYVDVKYKIGQVITADELPDSNDKRFANLNGSWVIKNWKWVTTSAPLPDDIIKDSDGNIISIRPTGVVIELFGNWVHGCTLTLMDGCSGASAGKEFSGVSKEPIKFWSGEEVKIPKPLADVSSSENTVEFDGWYTDAGLMTSFSAYLESDGYYHYPTDSYTTDTTIYAKWKYKYVYFDPANKTGKADDANTGIDRNHPVSTVAEAKKYMMSNDKAEAVKLMSGVTGNYSELNDLTTAAYNYAVLLRDSTFKGFMVSAPINNVPVEIQNVTFDGGYDGTDASKAKNTVINRGIIKLTNVIVKNNYAIDSGVSAVNADNEGYAFYNCEFTNNYSSQSVIKATNAGEFNNTSIHDNTGNGIYFYKGYPQNDHIVKITGCIIKKNKNGYNLHAVGTPGSNPCFGYSTPSGYTTFEISGSTFFENSGCGNGNIYAKDAVRIKVTEDVAFDDSPVNFDYDPDTHTNYPVFLLDSAYPGPKVTGTTNYVKIYSNHYDSNPIVLQNNTSDDIVAAKYTQFTCGHSSSGYGINSDGKIVPIGSISIGIDNPSGFTEIDLGDLAVTQVNLNASGNTVIRFNLNSGVADKLAEWTLTGTSNIAHPIQYMIDSTYGCVQTEYDSGTGKWYADIVIGRKPDDTIPNAFETSDNPYPLTKGLHTLQIYSEAKEANAVVTKKTYNIVVK